MLDQKLGGDHTWVVEGQKRWVCWTCRVHSLKQKALRPAGPWKPLKHEARELWPESASNGQPLKCGVGECHEQRLTDGILKQHVSENAVDETVVFTCVVLPVLLGNCILTSQALTLNINIESCSKSRGNNMLDSYLRWLKWLQDFIVKVEITCVLEENLEELFYFLKESLSNYDSKSRNPFPR